MLLLCSGHAAYGSAVDLYPNNTGVGATYFMTYHTILKESSDFIDGLKMSRILADNISQSIEHKVFAYRWVLLYCLLLTVLCAFSHSAASESRSWI